MKVRELFSGARNKLQDHDKNYWDDSELLFDYNQCKRSMASERLENKTTASLILDPLKTEYDTTGVLRYISAKDDTGKDRPLYPDNGDGDDDASGIIILDYNRVKINNNLEGSEITLKICAFPLEDNLLSDVRVGDEVAIEYYILSKSYEKDSDMQNFQKASYYESKYEREFKKLLDASSANYRTSTPQKTEASFY